MQAEGVQYVVEAEISQAMSNFQSLATQFKKIGIEVDDSKTDFKTLATTLDDTSNKFEEGGSDAKKFSKSIHDTGTKAKEVSGGMNELVGTLKKFLGTAALIGAGKKMVDLFGGFENQMNAVEAVSGSTAEEMKKLSAQALQLGADTNYSASEAGAAQEALLRLGNSAEQTMTMVSDVLSFDRANKVGDLAKSSEILSSSLKMFRMEAKDSTRAADAMAMTTKNSKTTVEYLSSAFNNAGADAKNFGYDIEDTLALIGAMSTNFADGGSAGTMLKGMFVDLSKNAKLFAKAGISVTDSKGRFRQIEDIVSDLNKKLSDKTPAKQQEILNKLFSDTGKQAYNALAAAGGSIDTLEEKIRNASGTTKTMAEIMDGGLKPKIDGMLGSMETLAISVGERLNPYMLDAVAGLTSLINSSSDAVSNFGTFYEENQLLIDSIGGLALITLTYLGITKTMAIWKAIETSMFTGGTIANTLYTASIRSMCAWNAAGTVGTGALASAQAFLNTLWMANPLVMVIGGMTLAIVAIRGLISHSETVRTAISKLWDCLSNSTIGKFIGGFVDSFEPLKNLVDTVGGLVKKIFGWKEEYSVDALGVNKFLENKAKGKGYKTGTEVDKLRGDATNKYFKEQIKFSYVNDYYKNQGKSPREVITTKLPVNTVKTATNNAINNKKIEQKNDVKIPINITIHEAGNVNVEDLANKVGAKVQNNVLTSFMNGANLAGVLSK